MTIVGGWGDAQWTNACRANIGASVWIPEPPESCPALAVASSPSTQETKMGVPEADWLAPDLARNPSFREVARPQLQASAHINNQTHTHAKREIKEL